MRAFIVASLAGLAVSVAGCSGGPGSRIDNAGLGAGVGAVVGGLAGSQFGKGNGRVLSTVAGVVAGGLIGRQLGSRLDDHDRDMAERAQYEALERGPSGRPLRWSDPENGRYGEIVPERPFQQAGADCRGYTHTIYIDGRPQSARGTACRDPDGRWYSSN